MPLRATAVRVRTVLCVRWFVVCMSFIHAHTTLPKRVGQLRGRLLFAAKISRAPGGSSAQTCPVRDFFPDLAGASTSRFAVRVEISNSFANWGQVGYSLFTGMTVRRFDWRSESAHGNLVLQRHAHGRTNSNILGNSRRGHRQRSPSCNPGRRGMLRHRCTVRHSERHEYSRRIDVNL